MSDATIAEIGRRLAEALARAGRERGDAWKAVYALQTELCAACLAELEQEKTKPSEET
jgi:hypothetical protein